jgi:hypothetical protein
MVGVPTPFSKRVRLGALAAAVVGFGGSFLAIVGTQGMTGHEERLALLKYFAVSFVVPYGVGAGLALLPTLLWDRLKGAKTYALMVAAFCLAAAASAVLCTALFHVLLIFIALPLILIPAVAGWWAAEYAIRRFQPGVASMRADDQPKV